MKLQNNFTSIEQSKRLLKLGIPANSADCFYIDEHSRIFVAWVYDIELDPAIKNLRYIPCWSVGRLIEIYLTCANDYVCDGCCAETPSLHFIQHDRDKLVSILIKLMSEDDMDFSKLEN